MNQTLRVNWSRSQANAKSTPLAVLEMSKMCECVCKWRICVLDTHPVLSVTTPSLDWSTFAAATFFYVPVNDNECRFGKEHACAYPGSRMWFNRSYASSLVLWNTRRVSHMCLGCRYLTIWTVRSAFVCFCFSLCADIPQRMWYGFGTLCSLPRKMLGNRLTSSNVSLVAFNTKDF